MRNLERVTSLKTQLLDIFMDMEVNEHEFRRRDSAKRHLRARRGIELHRECQTLARHLADPLQDATDTGLH